MNPKEERLWDLWLDTPCRTERFATAPRRVQDFFRNDVRVSENRGPWYSTLNSGILIIRTQKEGTPSFRRLPNCCVLVESLLAASYDVQDEP